MTASRMTSGLVSCSEMKNVLSLENAIKSLVRSQVVLSDTAFLRTKLIRNSLMLVHLIFVDCH
jgi:hypothetical protein